MNQNFLGKRLVRRAFFKLSLILGYEVTLREYFLPIEIANREDLIIKCLPFTMIGQSGLIDNMLAANYINANGIKGDVVEAGVHMGGSIALLSLAISTPQDRIFGALIPSPACQNPGRTTLSKRLIGLSCSLKVTVILNDVKQAWNKYV